MPCEAQPKASRANPGEIRRSLPHGSWRMTPGARVGVVVGAAVAATALVALLPRIAQDPAYHRFADRRTLWGVPHGLDVWSNLAFPLVGLWGLIRVVSAPAGGRDDPFTDPRERWPFAVVCVGVALTGLGSAWYHAAPDNARLVWDRLPMTLVFMGMLSAVVAERVGVAAGLVLLPVFLASGLASIAYWHASEAAGAGDLRPYVLVQFFPALAIPLRLWLFPARYTRRGAGAAPDPRAPHRVLRRRRHPIRLGAGQAEEGRRAPRSFLALRRALSHGRPGAQDPSGASRPGDALRRLRWQGGAGPARRPRRRGRQRQPGHGAGYRVGTAGVCRSRDPAPRRRGRRLRRARGNRADS